MLVVIPMAGLGSRFADFGFKTNKYLLPVDSKLTPMIHEAVKTIGASEDAKFVFVIRRDQVADVEPVVASLNLPNFHVHVIDEMTDGPASTVYELRQLLETDEELIVSNSDQVLEWNFDAFIETARGYDGCVLTYNPRYDLELGDIDKHSFIAKDENGKIVKVAEKRVLSLDALVGVHYYTQARHFLRAYEYMILHNVRAPNGEFYMSNSYQALLELGYNVGNHALGSRENFWPVGEPMDYFAFLKKNGWELKKHAFDGAPILFISTPGSYTLSGVLGYIEGPSAGLITRINGKFEIGEGESCVFVEQDVYFASTHVTNFIRGWFIGNFEPAIYKTREYEVGILHKSKTDPLDFHYHKEATEYNVFVKGDMEINGERLTPGQHFILDRNQTSCPIFHEDSIVLCVKLPSAPADKYAI